MNERNLWTMQEKLIMEAIYPHHGIKAVQRQLSHRTREGVKDQARALGLRRIWPKRTNSEPSESSYRPMHIPNPLAIVASKWRGPVDRARSLAWRIAA